MTPDPLAPWCAYHARFSDAARAWLASPAPVEVLLAPGGGLPEDVRLRLVAVAVALDPTALMRAGARHLDCGGVRVSARLIAYGRDARARGARRAAQPAFPAASGPGGRGIVPASAVTRSASDLTSASCSALAQLAAQTAPLAAQEAQGAAVARSAVDAVARAVAQATGVDVSNYVGDVFAASPTPAQSLMTAVENERAARCEAPPSAEIAGMTRAEVQALVDAGTLSEGLYRTAEGSYTFTRSASASTTSATTSGDGWLYAAGAAALAALAWWSL